MLCPPFRVWYGDSAVRAGHSLADWRALPSGDVQWVTQYTARTYPIWRADHWDTECYCQQWAGADYYWMTADGVIGAGQAPDVPEALPDGVTKRGGWLPDDAWRALADRAREARTAPRQESGDATIID